MVPNGNQMEKGSISPVKNVLLMLQFCCTTGLLSIMIVPVLATIAYGFGFCAVLILLAGGLHSLGVPWINMDLGQGFEAPISWSIPISLVLSAIIGGIALISHKYLHKFLGFVSTQYNKLDIR